MTLQDNISIHDAIAWSYDASHTEIYNTQEQARLKSYIESLVQKTEKKPPNILDFGAGTGNLTAHFLDAWCKVTAADISKKSLSTLTQKISHPMLSTQLINGMDLTVLQDDSFDIVAMYSVLHHVPDYLWALQECIRVLKPWGYLYIDHEHNEYYRDHLETFDYLHQSADRQTVLQKLQSLFHLPTLQKHLYIQRNKRRNPRYQYEWDIHVRPDDHIQRDDIKQLVTKNWWSVVDETNYLVFRYGYDMTVYNLLKDSLTDMKAIIFQI